MGDKIEAPFWFKSDPIRYLPRMVTKLHTGSSENAPFCYNVIYQMIIFKLGWNAYLSASWPALKLKIAASISSSLKGSLGENYLALIGTAPTILSRLFLLINNFTFFYLSLNKSVASSTAGHSRLDKHWSVPWAFEMCGMSRIFSNSLKINGEK